MKAIPAALLLLAVTFGPAASGQVNEDKDLIVLDEQVWILFYDVPARRFRRSRNAFVQKDWVTVANDLAVAAAFIRAEASRSADDLVYPLENVADRLEAIAENIDSAPLAGSDLDSAFARAHWLLAQHYLELAALARDSGNGQLAGSYLWATTHHLERAVLWSDARMTRSQIRSLEQLRGAASRLRDGEPPNAVFREKPLKLARSTLAELGEYLDREVWIEVN